MENADIDILLARKVDPSYPLPTMIQALRIALYDEYHAKAVYLKVLQTFGNVLPFSNIVQAEQRHIDELLFLFVKYGIEPVVDDWANKIIIEATLVENCEIGVAAEIENVKMYDDLIPYAQQPDVLDTFYRLQAASYNNHLPAFRQCVANYSQNQTFTNYTTSDPLSNLNPQNIQKMIQDFSSEKVNPNLQNITNIFGGMGTEFILGAAAGAVVVSLVSGGGLSDLFAKFSESNEDTIPDESGVPDNNKL
ncbi:MAG: DUF2202 domain-containing protein [Arcobacteraceae bacterium]|nr:DUF2202 domain-containing protein [Arcobacteraceae bacterium]MDY0328684.1 DUF2202 domain-containing protein [Arcobacteraceae bacterium]